MYGIDTRRAFISTVPFMLPDAHNCGSLPELLAWLPLQA
jgi:hypothetical protein